MRPIYDPAQEQWHQQVKALYILHYARLMKMATKMLGDAQQAEDVIQDVFFDLLRKQPLLVVPVELGAYVGVTVFNRCIDQLRLDKKRMLVYMELQALLQALESNEMPAAIAGEIDSFRADWYTRTLRHIEQLKGKHQQVVKARLLEGKSYEAIAAELAISAGHARQLFYEGRIKLYSLEHQYMLSQLGIVTIIAFFLHLLHLYTPA